MGMRFGWGSRVRRESGRPDGWGNGRAVVFLVAALVALAGPGGEVAGTAPADASVQDADTVRDTAVDGLTAERIFAGDELSPESFRGVWADDGSAWHVVEEDEEGRDELWRVEAESGERDRLISAAELVSDDEDEPLGIDGFSFSEDGRRVLLFTDARQVWRERTEGIYYVFDLEDRGLRPVSEDAGRQMFAKFSPDGRRVAFVRENDLRLTDLETGEERPLTTDGGEEILNGRTDWVYEEELGLQDAFRWSPDGTRIAYWRFDQSPIPPFYLVDETELYPRLVPIRYPKAGTDNSEVRIGAVELATGETTWFETGLADTETYLPRMEWLSDDTVVIQRLNRHQNRLDLLRADARTGEAEVFLTETDDAWVDVRDELVWIDDNERFVWSSERDGFRHLYLYERDGSLVRQLTEGEWPVTSFHGVDEETGRVYFGGARRGPLTRSVGYVSLDGSGPRWLVGPAAEESGDGEGAAAAAGVAGPGGAHFADFGPDYRYFTHTRSTIATPPVTSLRRSDNGAELRMLEENATMRARLDSLGLADPEFFTVRSAGEGAAGGTPGGGTAGSGREAPGAGGGPGADGSRELSAYRIRPPDFDESRAHPLLLYVYGGPGSQTVLDAWGGERYLWHQMMARRGIPVASVDNRGTGARGRAFRKQTYLNLGARETADQLAAARQLGELSWVDADRIGIWGWSYGGYMTLLTSLRSEGAIAAGISVAPVTHWKYYDTIYTERFMRTPEENPEGYERSAPLTYAADLESALLIVHGTADDNVHPQHTMRMVEELEEANRQFSMRFYPNKRHAISGAEARVNLFEMMTGFLEEELAAP